MRGRNAKRLRREAAGRTIGAPLRAYTVTTRPRLLDFGGKVFRSVRGTWELIPGCTRSVYQRLKRAA